MSFAPSPVSALDGTLFAFPYTKEVLFSANGVVAFSVFALWPAGLPAGTPVWFQFLVEDLSTTQGITLLNGVLAMTP